MRDDPLRDPAPLIRRVYSYVAYRIGDGAEAEDVTSEVFERALRYRTSYQEERGKPLQWLLGIARRCVEDARSSRPDIAFSAASEAAMADDVEGPADVEGLVIRHLSLVEAIQRLDDRGRDLIALRYGADLPAGQIGELLGMKTNAVEVALHRTLARLHHELSEDADEASPDLAETARRTSPG